MDVLPVSPSVAARRLLSMLRSEPSVLFVGAFVSSRPPSGLPMALELKQALVECMWTAGGQQLAPVLGAHPLALLNASRFLGVPLELVAEEVLKRTNLSIHDLLGWMGSAQPNNNHRVLAALANRHLANIVTTNFDELIEHEVSSTTHIEKLHGSLSDPDGMAIRLTQVGRGLVDRGFKRKISALINGKSVCFIGYAGRDPDIFPVLSGTKLSRVLWIARPCASAAGRASIARELKHCERLEEISKAFECLSVDGNQLFDELGSMLHLSLPADPAATFDWRTVMRSTAAPSSKDEAAVSLARILGAAGLWEQVAKACSWLYAHSGNPVTRLDAALFESEALYFLGEFTASESAAQRALVLCRRRHEPLRKARALQILGLIKGRSEHGSVRGGAARHIHGISRVLQSRPDTEARLLLANNYLNLGIWEKNHGRLREAKDSLDQGIRIARKTGDLRAQEKLHNAIGIVLRRRRQQLLRTGSSASSMRRAARRHLMMARELASYLGSAAEEVRVMLALIDLELDGVEYDVPGALGRGRVLLDECELLVKHSPEPEQVAGVKERRAQILIAAGAAQEAVSMISEALEAMITNTMRASGLKNRAAALEELGLHDEALRDLHDAMRLVPEGPDRTEIRMLLKNVEGAVAKNG